MKGLKGILKGTIFALIFLLMVPQVSLGYSGEEEENVELGESVKVEGQLSEPEFTTMAAHTAVTTLSGPTTVKKFVRYLTGSWAKASSYTWSKSQSASSTISSNVGVTAKGISNSLGVSNSVTTTYSVAITIPASNSKYSKLAFYSDYNKEVCQSKIV